MVAPWINIADRSCNGDCSSEFKRDTVLIAASCILQVVGVGGGVGLALARARGVGDSARCHPPASAACTAKGPCMDHDACTNGLPPLGTGRM